MVKMTSDTLSTEHAGEMETWTDSLLKYSLIRVIRLLTNDELADLRLVSSA